MSGINIHFFESHAGTSRLIHIKILEELNCLTRLCAVRSLVALTRLRLNGKIIACVLFSFNSIWRRTLEAWVARCSNVENIWYDIICWCVVDNDFDANIPNMILCERVKRFVCVSNTNAVDASGHYCKCSSQSHFYFVRIGRDFFLSMLCLSICVRAGLAWSLSSTNNSGAISFKEDFNVISRIKSKLKRASYSKFRQWLYIVKRSAHNCADYTGKFTVYKQSGYIIIDCSMAFGCHLEISYL